MTKRRSERQTTSRTKSGTIRETDLQRRVGFREQRRTILAVTNGESTERAYLEGLGREPWVRHRLVVVVEKGSPLGTVRDAARRRDDNDFDQTYVVCDVDQFLTGEATKEAQRLRVGLLWSNPCFEVWLILHHENCTRYLENAKKARDHLRRLVEGWDKTKLAFVGFRDGVDTATAHARALGEPPDANPSTAVWRLVEELRDPR
ncbi:RloB family protein [Micromonospora sp. SH-82]|uniref:RloB family protein n=1 Tax=Micromonospora sp. SH-82 TaxID=3132938 RepID=UPI003EC049E3